MPSDIDPKILRAVMGRARWQTPQPFDNGWSMVDRRGAQSIVVTVGAHPGPTGLVDGTDWVHASMTGPGRVPDYDELCQLFHATMPGFAYQVFAPTGRHINIHRHALHLWGRLDGEPALPDFGRYGTI